MFLKLIQKLACIFFISKIKYIKFIIQNHIRIFMTNFQKKSQEY